MPGKMIEENIIPAGTWMAVMKPLLDDGFELRLCPSGTSMLPFLAGGRDEVFLRSVKAKKPVRGDIALFSREDGLFVLHRIHHISQNRYYMLGDAQTWIEGPVKEENVQAIASAVMWKNKKISCDSLLLKLLTGTWLFLRPVRPQIVRFVRGIKRIFKLSSKA